MSLVNGDTHGRVIERLFQIPEKYNPEEIAIIILGDIGLNFWLNKTDIRNKKNVNECGFYVYCVRGNHELRPEDLQTAWVIYDDNVKGEVYVENEFPNIRYFKDGGTYEINGYKILIIGGAYSVDKWHRLGRAGLTEAMNDPAKTGWFSNEMLTPQEMRQISDTVAGKTFDFVFSHTCPLSWEPTDLFLNFIDQSKVDKSMEIWLDQLKDSINWGVWCFGHYHADRIEKEHVKQFYHNIQEMKDLWRELK